LKATDRLILWLAEMHEPEWQLAVKAGVMEED